MNQKYMQARKAIKQLILKVGVEGVYNYHINALADQGHSYKDLQNAMSYFRYSPQTAKYRGE